MIHLELESGADGKIPLAGNTVNVEEISYTNDIGEPFLATFWKNPDFDPSQSVFYYLRLLDHL